MKEVGNLAGYGDERPAGVKLREAQHAGSMLQGEFDLWILAHVDRLVIDVDSDKDRDGNRRPGAFWRGRGSVEKEDDAAGADDLVHGRNVGLGESCGGQWQRSVGDEWLGALRGIIEDASGLVEAELGEDRQVSSVGAIVRMGG